MKIHGITLAEGSDFANLTIDSGPAFPDAANLGELFYRTDPPNEGLYLNTGMIWTPVSTATLHDLITETPPLGLLSGGALTPAGGLVANVSAGVGYLRTAVGVVTRVTWDSTSVTIPPGTNPYIFIAADGTVQLTPTEPTTTSTILLGRAGAGATSLNALGSSAVNITNYGNKIEAYLRQAVGTVFVSGSIVTENATTPRALDISAGKLYYGTLMRNTSAKVAAPMVDIHRTGGAVVFTTRAVVPNDTIDDGTNLVPMTTGRYTKHVLYQTGEGAFQAYFLAHGQVEYLTLEDAQVAPLPIPRITPDATPHIASIIVRQGVNNIVQIDDVRPIIFRSTTDGGGGGGGKIHSSLIGLTFDDHPQYLLTTGARTLTGHMNIGGHDINNVGLIDGIDASAHAERHMPGGADPIPPQGFTGDVTKPPSSTVLTLSNTGVQSGTYQSVTVDLKGRVLSGSNPTTLSEYGITDAVPTNYLAVSNGVATLDATGRLTTEQIPSSLIGNTYKGTWNATTNTPTITSGVGTKGDFYIVSVAGSTSINGISTWGIGDQIIFNGTVWQRIAGSQAAVSSVAGRTGAITLSWFDVAGASQDTSVVHLSTVETITGAKTFTSLITGSISGNAATVTTNANMDGDVTSVGNVTTLPPVGLPGTYKSVTTDTKGRVVSGSNPTTLAGYGITNAVSLSMLGVANGVATLNSSGKVSSSQLPASGASIYQGVWNAATNTPTITSGVGTAGHYYSVGTAGASIVDGTGSWIVGDQIIFNGAVWEKIMGSVSGVTSVASRAGDVVLVKADITDLPDYQLLNSRLTDIANLSAGGFTALVNGTIVARTIESGAGIAITNPTGVGGNPIIALSGSIGSIENITTIGLLAKTGATTWATRQLVATANQITITSPQGVTGNPTISIASNPVIPGTGSMAIPGGTTEQRTVGPLNGSMRFNTTINKFEFYQSGQWTAALNSAGAGVVPAQMTQLLTGPVPALSGTAIIPHNNVIPSISNGSTLFARSITMSSAIIRVMLSFPFWIDVGSPNTTVVTQVFRAPFNGYQFVNVGGNKTNVTATNLVAGTTYTATITIDGTAYPVSVLGSNASTFETLVNAVQNAIGAAGTASLTGGNLRVISAISSNASSVSISSVGTLFKAPLNGYTSLSTAVPGSTPGCLVSLPSTIGNSGRGNAASIAIVDAPGSGTFTYTIRVGSSDGSNWYINSSSTGNNFGGFNTTSYFLMEIA